MISPMIAAGGFALIFLTVLLVGGYLESQSQKKHKESS